jgi:hypothetical protein
MIGGPTYSKDLYDSGAARRNTETRLKLLRRRRVLHGVICGPEQPKTARCLRRCCCRAPARRDGLADGKVTFLRDMPMAGRKGIASLRMNKVSYETSKSFAGFSIEMENQTYTRPTRFYAGQPRGRSRVICWDMILARRLRRGWIKC